MMKGDTVLAEALERTKALPLQHTAYDVCGRRFRISTDNAIVDLHFRTRLAPFVLAESCENPVAQVVALTSTEYTRAAGLADLAEHEALDAEFVTTLRDKNCVAVVSLPLRIVILGAVSPQIDLYWLVDYIAEIIPGLILGQDVVVLHASAVATPLGAVAFLGGPGSGKTTLALQLSSSDECAFIADDILLVERGKDGLIHAAPLYMDLHVAPETLALLPHLLTPWSTMRPGRDITGQLAAAGADDARKVRFSINTLWPDWRARSAALRAVIFPKRAPSRVRSRLCPLAADRGWAVLAAAVLPFLCDHWPSIVERDRAVLCQLLRQARCYRLYAGTDLRGLNDRIYEVL